VAVRIRLRSNSIKPQIDETVDRLKQRFAGTVTASAKQFADNVLREGRADIAAAGRFTGAWISGFTYDISGEDGKSTTIVFHHSKRLWRIFQKGATIKGDPLLWIPVEPGGPPASKFPGRLFQVKRLKKRDTPLLMSAEDHKVKYIGVKKVTIRRKFHLLKIIRDESKKLRDLFKAGMRNG
jgi:hypothetical protein